MVKLGNFVLLLLFVFPFPFVIATGGKKICVNYRSQALWGKIKSNLSAKRENTNKTIVAQWSRGSRNWSENGEI